MAELQIAALFETEDHARTAQDSLAATGIALDRITVLVPGAENACAQWGALKDRQIPDDDAHAYAEAIDRGHTVLIAIIAAAEQPAALAVLQDARPLNLDAHAESWRAEGWDGVNAGEADYLLHETPPGLAESSEGMRGGLITGDYGTVGAAMATQHADTDILRGTAHLARPADAVRIDTPEDVRLYTLA